MQRFHPHAEEWGQFVDVKVNAPDVLARQLRRLKPGEVFTCSACDGWQPVEEHYQLTRECCCLLLDAGFRTGRRDEILSIRTSITGPACIRLSSEDALCTLGILSSELTKPSSRPRKLRNDSKSPPNKFAP
jgi:hypothetical protein